LRRSLTHAHTTLSWGEGLARHQKYKEGWKKHLKKEEGKKTVCSMKNEKK
jgi:hypothetical protein